VDSDCDVAGMMVLERLAALEDSKLLKARRDRFVDDACLAPWSR
jgi:hypothetical protein